jgi:hypothetical protein
MIAADQALQAALDRAVESVGPLARPYPIYLTQPPDAESIAAVDLMERETLRRYAARAVKEWSGHPLDEDPRAAVSRLIRRYLGSVITAALVPLVHGVGLELAPERVRVIMQSDLPQGTVIDAGEILLTAERPATWPVRGTEVASIAELRDRVFAALLGHISWSFAAITASIKVSPNLLWSTAAEQIDLLWSTPSKGERPRRSRRRARIANSSSSRRTCRAWRGRIRCWVSSTGSRRGIASTRSRSAACAARTSSSQAERRATAGTAISSRRSGGS